MRAASFMMVSLQMQKVRTLKAGLPTAALAPSANKPNMVALIVGRNGQVAVQDKAGSDGLAVARRTHASEESAQGSATEGQILPCLAAWLFNGSLKPECLSPRPALSIYLGK